MQQEIVMKTDKTTKILLGLIALALFLNAIVPLIQPAVVRAQDISTIETYLGAIYNGLCLNPQIC